MRPYEAMMPTNPTLPTLAQVIEEVKKQNWGHEWKPVTIFVAGIPDALPDQNVETKKCSLCDAPHFYSNPCPARIARAQQVAVAKALRWATIKYFYHLTAEIYEAVDAIEKELER